MITPSIHGWLVISKPRGPTSFDVIRQVRRLWPKIKCGHAGTLDPLASGVLPLALGEATKVIAWLMDARKVYHFTVAWGEQRTTDDDDEKGIVMARSSVRPSAADIENILPQFQDTIVQVPPVYSAIKIQGQRACDRARHDQIVNLQPRSVYVESLRLVDQPDKDHACFELTCGKGVYVRSLARDIALALGTVGHTVRIHRVRVGKFDDQTAISLETLAKQGSDHVLDCYVRSLDAVLDDILAVQVNQQASITVRQGQVVKLDHIIWQRGDLHDQQAVLIYDQNRQPLAMGQYINHEIRPQRVFNFKP